MLAVGGYFEGAREERGYTPSEVAVAMKARLGRNVDPSTIWKIENGSIKSPGADLLLALVDVLKVSARDVWELMQQPDASKARGLELGRSVARTAAVTDEEIARLRQLPPAEREKLMSYLESRLRELS